MLFRALLLVTLLAAMPVVTHAQSLNAPSAPTVLVIDQERLLQETQFGIALRGQVSQRAQELAAENRQIEVDLTAEELELTNRRTSMAPDEFRVLADAFDTKVQAIRAEQEQKSDELAVIQDEGRQRFFSEVLPIISDILNERGALILIDKRNALLSADTVEITDEAIRRADESLRFEAELQD